MENSQLSNENAARRTKYDAVKAYFTIGSSVACRTTMGTEYGVVDSIEWSHDLDRAIVCVRVPSRFADYALGRFGPENVFLVSDE